MNKSQYRGHQGVENADSEGCAASKGLSEVQLSVRVIVIILVQKLDIAVIDQLGDHWDIGAIHRALPLQHNGAAERRFARTLLKYRKKMLNYRHQKMTYMHQKLFSWKIKYFKILLAVVISNTSVPL